MFPSDSTADVIHVYTVSTEELLHIHISIFRLPPPLSEPGRFLWVRQLHREHRWQRADELPIQPCDGDDPRWLHDVRRCRIPHDDPALPSGH